MSDIDPRDMDQKSWQNAFEGAELTPPGKVWEGVSSALAQDEALMLKKRLNIYKWVAAASVFFMLTFGALAFLNNDETRLQAEGGQLARKRYMQEKDNTPAGTANRKANNQLAWSTPLSAPSALGTYPGNRKIYNYNSNYVGPGVGLTPNRKPAQTTAMQATLVAQQETANNTEYTFIPVSAEARQSIIDLNLMANKGASVEVSPHTIENQQIKRLAAPLNNQVLAQTPTRKSDKFWFGIELGRGSTIAGDKTQPVAPAKYKRQLSHNHGPQYRRANPNRSFTQ